MAKILDPAWAWVALQVADTLKAGGNAESAVHIIQHIILAHGLLIGISWEVHLEGMIQVYCGMGKQVMEAKRNMNLGNKQTPNEPELTK